MATVLVSFIGLGNYQTCDYIFGERICNTHLFVFALSNFYKEEIDKLIIFLTEKSRNAKRDDDKLTYFQQLERLNLKNGLVKPEKVLIKSGKSESELWEMFETIAAKLTDGDEVIFDITHAFRSIPIMSLLVIALLRETKNIKLKAILYGAFDAKDKDGNTPLFDLTPFVELLDWLSAAKQFKNTGNAQFLVELLQNNNDKNLADNISELSESLRLLRPVNIMEKSQRLSYTLSNEKATSNIKSKPVFELLESIKESYSKFSLGNPKQNKEEFIRKLFDLANWYYEKGQYVQSIATIREFIPTVVCYKLNLDFFKRDDNRHTAESYLNQREGSADEYDWNDTKLPEELKSIWANVTQLRNDVLHVGFNESPRRINNIVAKNKEFLDAISEIKEAILT